LFLLIGGENVGVELTQALPAYGFPKNAPDAFWLTREKLLRNLAKVANERDGSHR